MQFGLWRAAAFVSSPIHLFYTEWWLLSLSVFSLFRLLFNKWWYPCHIRLQRCLSYCVAAFPSKTFDPQWVSTGSGILQRTTSGVRTTSDNWRRPPASPHHERVHVPLYAAAAAGCKAWPITSRPPRFVTIVHHDPDTLTVWLESTTVFRRPFPPPGVILPASEAASQLQRTQRIFIFYNQCTLSLKKRT